MKELRDSSAVGWNAFGYPNGAPHDTLFASQQASSAK